MLLPSVFESLYQKAGDSGLLVRLVDMLAALFDMPYAAILIPLALLWFSGWRNEWLMGGTTLILYFIAAYGWLDVKSLNATDELTAVDYLGAVGIFLSLVIATWVFWEIRHPRKD